MFPLDPLGRQGVNLDQFLTFDWLKGKITLLINLHFIYIVISYALKSIKKNSVKFFHSFVL